MREAPVKVIGGYRPASEVGPADVAAWLRPIHRRAPAAANQYRAWLSAAYTWALKREHDYTIDQPQRWGVTSNPAAMVPPDTAARRAGTRHLSPEEFTAVWHWLALDAGRSDARACNALRLIMATGQRVEEIVHLRAGQWDGTWLRWERTKVANRPHSVPVPAPARALLDTMPPNRHGLLVPGCKDPAKPYRCQSLDWITRRCADQLGIQHFSPRDLRRTWRTLADAAGLSGEEAARIMNHAWGSAIEAKHYDMSQYVAAKVAGMAKWEARLTALIGAKPRLVADGGMRIPDKPQPYPQPTVTGRQRARQRAAAGCGTAGPDSAVAG